MEQHECWPGKYLPMLRPERVRVRLCCFGRCSTPTSVDLHAPSMREMNVAEQRYLAVLAVIADGRDVTAAA
jgi:hypothetical protein